MLINGADLTNENFSKEKEKSSMCAEDKIGTYIADKKWIIFFFYIFLEQNLLSFLYSTIISNENEMHISGNMHILIKLVEYNFLRQNCVK